MKITNTEIEKKLSDAVEKMVPDNMLERIEQNIVPKPERTVINMTSNNTKKSVKWIGVAVAACLVIAIGIFGAGYYSNNFATDSVVDIDVNPSIEIVTNKNDKVIKVNAVNDDADKILDGMDLRKSDLKVAVNAIIGSMAKQGYLTADGNEILVTVQNNDLTKAESIKNTVISNISAALDKQSLTASVINQTVNESSDKAKAFAEKHNISVGKAIFILKLAEKDSSLNADELATMKIRDIARLINRNKINIADIVDYDSDDSVWENIADEIEDLNENNIDTSGIISADEAKSIALKHAGVSADKAHFTLAELDTDDGKRVYDIEFCYGGTSYEYEINAETGKIVSRELDDDCGYHGGSGSGGGSGTGSGSGSGNGSGNGTGAGNGSTNTIITAAKAKSIALSNAGLAGCDVTFTKVERDRDDGVTVYEIEFYWNGYEYEYEINAVTGKIIEKDKEPID